jgi:hypothetical protein
VKGATTEDSAPSRPSSMVDRDRALIGPVSACPDGAREIPENSSCSNARCHAREGGDRLRSLLKTAKHSRSARSRRPGAPADALGLRDLRAALRRAHRLPRRPRDRECGRRPSTPRRRNHASSTRSTATCRPHDAPGRTVASSTCCASTGALRVASTANFRRRGQARPRGPLRPPPGS